MGGVMHWKKFLILFGIYLFYIFVLGGFVFRAFETPQGCSWGDSISADPVETGDRECMTWNIFNSSFVAYTAITTIGYGAQAPVTQKGRLYCIFYSLVGVPLNAVTIITLASYMTMGTKWILNRPHLNNALDQWKSWKRTCVGATLALIFFCIFILVPTVAIVVSEDWSWVDGFYFCFITLSTIGFGDLVAGRGAGNARRVLVGWKIVGEIAMMLWIFVGLAYIVMVFNLITEATTKTIRKINPKQKANLEQAIGDMLTDIERKSRMSKLEGREEDESQGDKERIVHEYTTRIAEELANKNSGHRSDRKRRDVNNNPDDVV